MAAQTEEIELVRRACQQICPIYPDYATRPIQDGFSWSSSLAGCAFERLYLVVFRSVRRPSADLDLLREHDDCAYEKALESGGLLRYFKGEANERGECLSFCLWETRRQAIRAAGAPSHQSAADISVRMYESYVLDRYWLKKVVAAREETHLRADSAGVDGSGMKGAMVTLELSIHRVA